MSSSIVVDEVARSVERLRDLKEGPAALPGAIVHGERAIPALEALLRAPTESVPQPRCLAAAALAAIGGPEAERALIEALADSSSRSLNPVLRHAEDAVVNRVAEGLASAESPEATGALREALRWRCFAGCAEALGRRQDAAAIPMLVRCLNDDFARDSARRALVALGRRALPALIAVQASRRAGQARLALSSVSKRVAALEGLAEIGGPEAVHALLSSLRDRQREVRAAAALALGGARREHARSVLPVLVEALGDPDFSMRARASAALAELAAAAEQTLLAVVRIPDRSVEGLRRRQGAVALLAHLGGIQSVETLAQLVREPDGALRVDAVDALGHLPGSLATLALARYTADDEVPVRLRAVETLARRGDAAVDTLARALLDDDARVRRAAAEGLRRMGARALSGLRVLLARKAPGEGFLGAWHRRRVTRRALLELFPRSRV